MLFSEPVLRVALPLPLPQLFDYLPPINSDIPHIADVGRRIKVLLGKREVVGVVADVGQSETLAPLRHAQQWLDETPLLQGELLASLRWLARYIHAPLGEVLATALPTLLRHGQGLPDESHNWGWQLTDTGRNQFHKLRRNSRPQQLALHLQSGAISESMLTVQLPGWRTAARALEQRDFIQRVPLPGTASECRPQLGPVLNKQQQTAVKAITQAKGFAAFLLDGITGSGKTEVYLQAIVHCLQQGRQALVLVPEIGLTGQILERFGRRLGVPVHALHSGLSDHTRTQVWAAAQRGQARLIVGTRSAIFTPLPHAGLIIIDEEHDSSYKQHEGLRYHARDFALVRGKTLKVPVILGSATPSLESLHNANLGRYMHLHLHYRAAEEAKLPQVRVLDIRKRRLIDGLCTQVLAAIDQHLQTGHQVLVFRNRRGYAPVLLCHDCGWSATCKQCSTAEQASAMTVHASGQRLQCHHCGQRAKVPLACPDCGSLALQSQGIGTQRLEQRLQHTFADYPVLRIDRDTTRRRDALARTLADLGDKPGLLVGTQMLAKGHDLANLTLVVVVNVDEGLFSADFRASEKLAQQLLQVAGRAGRAQRPGEVWLQTHHPDNGLLHTLLNGGYRAFAQTELEQRKLAGFPPFAYMALLRAQARQIEMVTCFLEAIKLAIPDDSSVEYYGPLPAPMPRRAGFVRSQLLFSCSQRRALHVLLDQLLPLIYAHPLIRQVRWSLDIDPVDLY